MSLKAKGAMGVWKKIKISPYVTKVYSPGHQQLAFPGTRKKKTLAFDFSLRIPRNVYLRGRKHVRRHKNLYLTGGVGGLASFAGSKAASQRKRRRK